MALAFVPPRSRLTEAVRRRPYSVVLLDEVEKANPEVFDILLQVLDDGRLTDGQGRTVDFRNTILILTSNMGSQFLIDQTEPYDVRKEQVMAVVRQHFRPEFLNRLDALVMFNPLDKAELERIARLQVEQLQKRLRDRRITLDITDEALQWLVNKGYDPAYGARPVRRARVRAMMASIFCSTRQFMAAAVIAERDLRAAAEAVAVNREDPVLVEQRLGQCDIVVV